MAPGKDGFVDNEADATAVAGFACRNPVWIGWAPRFGIGGVIPTIKLLRNASLSCLQGAFPAMRAFLRQRPMPQECSEPPAIDVTHPGTQVMDRAVAPLTVPGDADPGLSQPQCPQSPAGAGRVLVFYELDEPPPPCVDTLRVAKAGPDIVVTW